MSGKETVLHVLNGLMTGAPVGAAIVGIGNTAAVLRHLPKATLKAYRALWRTKKIGPVLKTTVSAAAPIGIALVPSVALLGSTVGGMAYGFYCGIGGTGVAADKSIEVVRLVRKGVEAGLIELEAYVPAELEEGQRPYDIRVLEGLRGLLAPVLGAPIEGVGLAAVALRWLPTGWWRTNRTIWAEKREGAVDLAIAGSASVLSVPVAVLCVPLVPAASLLFSVGDTCVQGYRHGIGAAFAQGLKRMRDLNALFREAAHGLDQELARERAHRALLRSEYETIPGHAPDGMPFVTEELGSATGTSGF